VPPGQFRDVLCCPVRRGYIIFWPEGSDRCRRRRWGHQAGSGGRDHRARSLG